ncbi:MAG: Gfo/Idh/MocA family protein [Phycisphaerae bacterium]
MNPVRIAILGCGGMAGGHARKLKVRNDVEIVALCDIDPARIESLCQRRLAEVDPAPARFTDPAEMYDQAKPDAVVIVTPHALHYDQAVEALDRGCHVLLEKPMVTSPDQARDLAEKVQQSGKVLIVCYNTAFTRPMIYVRQAIRDGRLGRLEMVTGYLAQNWKKLTAGSWRQDPAVSGGGQAFDSGAHLLNSLCWSLQDRPAQVFAIQDNQQTPVDINTVLSVRFDSGVLANIAIGGNSLPDASHLAYIFENGRIEVDGWSGRWLRACTGEGPLDDLPQGQDEPDPDANFIETILGNQQPLVTAADGLVQAELIDAIYRSADSGAAVAL